MNKPCQLTAIPNSTPTYDRRGNLTQRYFPSGPQYYWNYTYDAENQLVSVATDTAGTLEAYRFKVELGYDGAGRLRIKRDYTWDTAYNQWSLSAEIRYLYDLSAGQAGGLLIVQERNSANTPLVTYTRGRDLSGSLDGAGGIGGLLARSHGYSGGNWSSHNFYHADGNGNVTALVNSSGVLQAGYKYDPYGRYLGGSGTLASANLMRFSSKPWVGFAGSSTAGLYSYGYRFYDPYLQRWSNRDPIDELEHLAESDFESLELNLYGFAANNPNYYYDSDGKRIKPIIDLCKWIIGKCKPKPKPKPNPQPKPKPNPCGDCTPAEHAALNAAVGAACKSEPRRCEEWQDQATLQANLAKNLACAAARDAMNKKCFKGGDPGHKAKADEARGSAARCAEILARKYPN